MEYMFPEVKENYNYKVVPTGKDSPFGMVILFGDMPGNKIHLKVVLIRTKDSIPMTVKQTLFETYDIPYKFIREYKTGKGFSLQDIGESKHIYLVKLLGTKFDITLDCEKYVVVSVPKQNGIKKIGTTDLGVVMLNTNITISQVVEQLRKEGYDDSTILKRLVNAIGELTWEE